MVLTKCHRDMIPDLDNPDNPSMKWQSQCTFKIIFKLLFECKMLHIVALIEKSSTLTVATKSSFTFKGTHMHKVSGEEILFSSGALKCSGHGEIKCVGSVTLTGWSEVRKSSL